jgi:hypothetical protein
LLIKEKERMGEQGTQRLFCRKDRFLGARGWQRTDGFLEGVWKRLRRWKRLFLNDN